MAHYPDLRAEVRRVLKENRQVYEHPSLEEDGGRTQEPQWSLRKDATPSLAASKRVDVSARGTENIDKRAMRASLKSASAILRASEDSILEAGEDSSSPSAAPERRRGDRSRRHDKEDARRRRREEERREPQEPFVMEVLDKERPDEALEAERRFLEARAARYGAGRAVEFKVPEPEARETHVGRGHVWEQEAERLWFQGQLRERREAERRVREAEAKQQQARRRAHSGRGRQARQTRRLYMGVYEPYPEQEEPAFIAPCEPLHEERRRRSRLRPLGLAIQRGAMHPHTLVGPAFKAAHAKSIIRSSLEACAKQLERRMQSIERYIDAPPSPPRPSVPRPSVPPPAPPSSANSTMIGAPRQARRPIVKVTLKPRSKGAEAGDRREGRPSRHTPRRASSPSPPPAKRKAPPSSSSRAPPTAPKPKASRTATGKTASKKGGTKGSAKKGPSTRATARMGLDSAVSGPTRVAAAKRLARKTATTSGGGTQVKANAASGRMERSTSMGASLQRSSMASSRGGDRPPSMPHSSSASKRSSLGPPSRTRTRRKSSSAAHPPPSAGKREPLSSLSSFASSLHSTLPPQSSRGPGDAFSQPLAPAPSSSMDSAGPPIDLAKYYKDTGLPMFSDNDESGPERKYLALSSSSSESEDSPFAGLRGAALDLEGLEGSGAKGLTHSSIEDLEHRLERLEREYLESTRRVDERTLSSRGSAAPWSLTPPPTASPLSSAAPLLHTDRPGPADDARRPSLGARIEEVLGGGRASPPLPLDRSPLLPTVDRSPTSDASTLFSALGNEVLGHDRTDRFVSAGQGDGVPSTQDLRNLLDRLAVLQEEVDGGGKGGEGEREGGKGGFDVSAHEARLNEIEERMRRIHEGIDHPPPIPQARAQGGAGKEDDGTEG